MLWSRGVLIALGLLSALLLSACADDATPTYRYRLKVEVETPEGSKSGSSVIEVATHASRTAMDPSAQAVQFKLRGEAAVVDLGKRGLLFALLRSGNDIDWASRVMLNVAPKTPQEPFLDQFDNMKGIKGEVTLPRRWPPGPLDASSAYPMLVTFGDLADSKSVKQVDPDYLAATFGKGVKLKRITVEMTDAPVTVGIEKRLMWLPNYYDKMLDGQTINTIDARNRFANDLSQGDFSKGALQ